MVMHKKIIYLVIFLLLFSELLPFGIGNRIKGVKNYQASSSQICCCGIDAGACRDCCCAVVFGEEDGCRDTTATPQEIGDADKRIVMINACGGGSDGASLSPELIYIASSSYIVRNMPFIISIRANAKDLKDTIPSPLYKPPKL